MAKRLRDYAAGLTLFVLISCVSTDTEPTGNLQGAPNPWQSENLFQIPEMKWLRTDSAVNSLLYQSIDIKGKKTEVFAYYSDPDLVAGKPVSGKQFPAVVLVHGGGGKAFPQWVAKWAQEGYAAIAMDLGGKDGNGANLQNAGPDQSFESKWTRFKKDSMPDSWNHFSVAGIILGHSLLRSFPQVDTARTFLTGISWGGYLTCIVAALDNRFKAAAPVYGCGFYDESDAFKKSMEVMKKADRQAWLQLYDPAVYVNRINMPVFFLNGNKDEYYNIVPFHKTYSLVPGSIRQVRLLPDMKHGHAEGWNPAEIRAFFEQVIHQKNILTRVKAPNLSGKKVQVSYVPGAAPLDSARFWFSSDTISLNKERKWESVTATIEPHQVNCAAPPQWRYGFFVVKDSAGLIVSSELMIRE